jgi:ABC-type transport system involved in multi-copper enzyme maturation permease subunit
VKAVMHVLERDFRYFFRYKWWIVGMLSMSLADLFIMAIVYTGMVRQEITEQYVSYFLFFSPGITITALFAAAFMIGREINREVRRGISHYMLSLPIKRWELSFGRVLAGGLRGMVYMTPLLLMTLTITSVWTHTIPSPLQTLTILLALFFISVGTSGLSITLALSTTSLEKYVTARGVVYYMLFFCSTVFYPLNLIKDVMPQFFELIAQYNPLSCGADLARSFLLGYPSFEFVMLLDLVVFASIFTSLSMFAYMKVVQK